MEAEAMPGLASSESVREYPSEILGRDAHPIVDDLND